MSKEFHHVTVLLDRYAGCVKPDGIYADVTCGAGQQRIVLQQN